MHEVTEKLSVDVPKFEELCNEFMSSATTIVKKHEQNQETLKQHTRVCNAPIIRLSLL